MMRKLQDSILSLLIDIIVLFNIERLDFNGQDVINLDTGIYVLTVVVILLILTIKWLSALRQPILIALATVVFFIVKLMLLNHRPLVGGIYTYLSFTELGLFIVTVFLAQNLATNIKELEQSTKVFSYANIRKIKGVREAYKEIEAEIYRSRRFHRPLSILVLEQNTEGIQANISNLAKNAQRAMVEQYFSVIVAKELVTQLRETDLVLENDKNGKLVILSPDTGLTQAETLMSRLNSLSQSTEVSINFGAATFPDHALTFEQLLEHAELNLQQRTNGHHIAHILKKDQPNL
jgi:predicted signal transduction protein with EAL and GGDEF domain